MNVSELFFGLLTGVDTNSGAETKSLLGLKSAKFSTDDTVRFKKFISQAIERAKKNSLKSGFSAPVKRNVLQQSGRKAEMQANTPTAFNSNRRGRTESLVSQSSRALENSTTTNYFTVVRDKTSEQESSVMVSNTQSSQSQSAGKNPTSVVSERVIPQAESMALNFEEKSNIEIDGTENDIFWLLVQLLLQNFPNSVSAVDGANGATNNALSQNSTLLMQTSLSGDKTGELLELLAQMLGIDDESEKQSLLEKLKIVMPLDEKNGIAFPITEITDGNSSISSKQTANGAGLNLLVQINIPQELLDAQRANAVGNDANSTKSVTLALTLTPEMLQDLQIASLDLSGSDKNAQTLFLEIPSDIVQANLANQDGKDVLAALTNRIDNLDTTEFSKNSEAAKSLNLSDISAESQETPSQANSAEISSSKIAESLQQSSLEKTNAESFNNGEKLENSSAVNENLKQNMLKNASNDIGAPQETNNNGNSSNQKASESNLSKLVPLTVVKTAEAAPEVSTANPMFFAEVMAEKQVDMKELLSKLLAKGKFAKDAKNELKPLLSTLFGDGGYLPTAVKFLGLENGSKEFNLFDKDGEKTSKNFSEEPLFKDLLHLTRDNSQKVSNLGQQRHEYVDILNKTGIFGKVSTSIGQGMEDLESVLRNESRPNPANSTMAKDIFNQITERISLTAINANNGEVRIFLRPEALGDLQLKIKIENDVVVAKFIAQSQEVKGIIESNLSQLKNSLSEQGVKVGKITVSMDSNSNQQSSPNNHHQQNNSSATLNYGDQLPKQARMNYTLYNEKAYYDGDIPYWDGLPSMPIGLENAYSHQVNLLA